MQDSPYSPAYSTRMNARCIPALAAVCVLLAGCHDNSPPQTTAMPSQHDEAVAANQLFLNQKNFDPWVLTTSGHEFLPAYLSDGKTGEVYSADGTPIQQATAGRYTNGQLNITAHGPKATGPYDHTLNMNNGRYTVIGGAFRSFPPLLRSRSDP